MKEVLWSLRATKEEKEARRWQCLVGYDNKQEDGNKENGKETQKRSQEEERPLIGWGARHAPLPNSGIETRTDPREQPIWTPRRRRQKKIKDTRTTREDNRLACFFLRLFRAFLSPLSLVLASALVQSLVHCIWLEVIVNWNEFQKKLNVLASFFNCRPPQLWDKQWSSD